MLDEKEAQLLDAIEGYINENGFSPTVRELGEVVGLKSSSTVHAYLKKLETKGFIQRLENFPRALRLVKSHDKI